MAALHPSTAGESICYRTHPHWIVLAWPMMLGAFFALPLLVHFAVAFIMEGGPKPAGWVTEFLMPGAATLLWLVSLLHYLASSFAITSHRVIMRSAAIQDIRINTRLQDIRSIDVHQGRAGRLMGYGVVTLRGPSGLEKFSYVPDPDVFKQRILQQRSNALARSRQIAA